MTKPPSFTARIILAMILMVGFYLLAIGIALGLFFIPYAEVVYANRIHIKLAALCVIGGCMILWSVLPRFDRFIPPGPRLTEDEQPELFDEIRSIAKATNQSMPVEVFAVPEMNAWVTNRGGVMGIGSKRVMGLGIPLMQVLSRQQFRGVLAHEFGHYYSGDTKLGPWIYVTRSAIIRTVATLAEQGSNILSLPFEWYGKLFLRITQSISRHQEYTADALAATVAGPQALIEGLKVIHSSAQAFDAYWQNEYVPVLNGGFRTPLVSGFQAFFQTPQIQTSLKELMEQELKSGNANPYDSHPALRERIAALDKLTGPEAPADDPPFIKSIRNLDELEQRMIAHLAAAVKVELPSLIAWDDVAEKIWVPFWTKNVEQSRVALKGVMILDAGRLVRDPERLLGILSKEVDTTIPAEIRRQWALSLVQMAVSVALHREGWRIETPIGSPVVAVRGEQRFEPFTLLGDLAAEKITPAAYEQACISADVVDVVIDPVAKSVSG